ncbi:MAG: 23S rRNA (guanosine(2251)-2'-O)-methyltransferase RlmB [Acidimicrobiales bacterium]
MEGRQAVRELLAAGRRPVREVWIADDLDPSPQIDDIERLATRRHVRLIAVSRTRLAAAARTDAPQGVLAQARPLEEVDLDDLNRSRRGVAPFLLVLDGVTDPHNVGSLLRTAECAGVTGVVLPRHRAAHVTPTVAKVAAGAIEHLPIAVAPGVPSALRRLEELGTFTVGLDADAPLSLFDLELDAGQGVALVMGAEDRGLASLTRRRCAALVSIPQFGTLGALNVAAAGAVACFELARRRARGSAASGGD